MPRLDRVVARFTAPKPPRLGKVKWLRVRGRVLTWRHRPGLRYEVAIATRDGAERLAAWATRASGCRAAAACA